ncbi:MAG: hypothetical protein LBC78_04315 [Oscillospiraceae bacterium]|jgi:hypothetical protein|nr:hypothetical protein [Oscillospiraceae bacterium]
MSLLKEIKCGRCDRLYSPLLLRCPNCHARRGAKSKYANYGDLRRGRIIICLALIFVVSAAIIVLATSVGGADNPAATTPSQNLPATDDDIHTVNSPDIDTPEPITTPPDTPPPVVESVKIMYGSTVKTDFSIKVGESVNLKAKITPSGIEGLEPVWESTDSNIFDVVVKADSGGMSVKVTGIKAGNAKLVLTVDGKSVECIVRVRA